MRKAVATGAVRGRRRVRVIAIRLGIKLGLVTAILATMGSFAVVAGGISPADVFAPRQSEGPNVFAAASVPEPAGPVAVLDPLELPAQSAIPSADFIRGEIAALPTIVPGKRLSETELLVYASLAGWPSDLHDELLVVANCESKNRPYATNGIMRGLMQLDPIWFNYSANSISEWADPITNLRVAYSTYLYDIGRGYTPWHQWQCKPDGTVAPAPIPVPALVIEEGGPALAASNADATTAEAAAEPTPTVAPWDVEPSWPPKPKGDDGAATPTPAP